MNRRTFRILAFLLALALVMPLVFSGTALADVEKPFEKPNKPHVSIWLTILHNNDGESQLINRGSGLEDFGGVARFKTLVDELRADGLSYSHFPYNIPAKKGVLMLSSGDNFLAGPEFNASLEKGVPYYDTIAMDHIGYNAVAIGNHDFDFNPDVLANFIEGYELTMPPYLSSNLIFDEEPRLKALEDAGRIADSTIVRFGRNRIGIIGATTPALRFISSPRDVIVMDDVAAAVQAEVDYLTAQEVGIIILISHLQSIEEDLALAPMLDGVDIMIAGGGDEILANESDLLIPGDEGNIYGPYPMWATDMDGTMVPVVTTAGNYAYVGQLVAGFDRYGELLLIDEKNSGPNRVAGGDNVDAVAPDPTLMERVVDPIVEFLSDLASTVIGTSEVDLDGVRQSVRTMETNEGNLIADSLFWTAEQLAADFGTSLPDVALQNGGGIRNDSVIAAGDITELDTFDMVPFANFVSVVEGISREQFKEILENAVSRVEFGDGRFAQVSGFSYSYDPAGTAQVLDADGNVTSAGTRVWDVMLNDGTMIVDDGVVQPGDALSVATIDFLARGGDQYPFRGAEFTTLGVTYQQALSNYIRNGLSGLISAADYPEGGEGRITTVSP
jgi:5'-nucleotidase